MEGVRSFCLGLGIFKAALDLFEHAGPSLLATGFDGAVNREVEKCQFAVLVDRRLDRPYLKVGKTFFRPKIFDVLDAHIGQFSVQACTTIIQLSISILGFQ